MQDLRVHRLTADRQLSISPLCDNLAAQLPILVSVNLMAKSDAKLQSVTLWEQGDEGKWKQ